jgi:hypothetical protein
MKQESKQAEIFKRKFSVNLMEVKARTDGHDDRTDSTNLWVRAIPAATNDRELFNSIFFVDPQCVCPAHGLTRAVQ